MKVSSKYITSSILQPAALYEFMVHAAGTTYGFGLKSIQYAVTQENIAVGEIIFKIGSGVPGIIFYYLNKTYKFNLLIIIVFIS